MSNSSNIVMKATGWSFFSEVAAKLISPILNIILARLLTPEAFGVIATVTMVTSFAELIAEAGFQRYIIQKKYENEDEKWNNISVAFWSNLFFSLFLWFVIILLRDKIAYLVGTSELGDVIALASVTIPLMAFSSIQTAVFKKELQFDVLFWARLISCLVPLLVTVPLAYVMRNYWALIIGNITLNVVSAILLGILSKWRPRFFFSIKMLNQMLSFSLWSMAEQFSVWMTANAGIFIIGRQFNEYYTGMYRVIITTVNQILGLVSAAVIPVAFAALSKCKKQDEFNKLYCDFERCMGVVLIPISFGVLIFNQTITKLLLGSQWMQISLFLGLWGFARGFVLVLGSLASEGLKAAGKPRTAFASQCIYLLFLIPAIFFSSKIDFSCLMYTQSLVSTAYIVVQCIFIYAVFRITPWMVLKNIFKYIYAAGIMGIVGVFIKMLYSEDIMLDIMSIVICGCVYIFVLLLFRSEREMLKNMLKLLKR